MMTQSTYFCCKSKAQLERLNQNTIECLEEIVGVERDGTVNSSHLSKVGKRAMACSF